MCRNPDEIKNLIAHPQLGLKCFLISFPLAGNFYAMFLKKNSFARPLFSVRHRFISVEDISPSLLYSLQDEEFDTEFRWTSCSTAVRENGNAAKARALTCSHLSQDIMVHSKMTLKKIQWSMADSQASLCTGTTLNDPCVHLLW